MGEHSSQKARLRLVNINTYYDDKVSLCNHCTATSANFKYLRPRVVDPGVLKVKPGCKGLLIATVDTIKIVLENDTLFLPRIYITVSKSKCKYFVDLQMVSDKFITLFFLPQRSCCLYNSTLIYTLFIFHLSVHMPVCHTGVDYF